MVDRVELTARLTWWSYGCLLAVLVTESLVQQAPWIAWLVRLLPLLVFLPGMRSDNLRSFIWLCFVCLLYFTGRVLQIFAQPTDILSWLGMASVVTLFTAAMLYVRWRARALQAEGSNE